MFCIFALQALVHRVHAAQAVGQLRREQAGLQPPAPVAVAERAACQTFAMDFGALNAFHFKPDDAVVHRYGVAGLQVLVEILIIDTDLRLVPCHVLRGKGEAVPRFHFHLTGSKCSDAVLRAFGVQHDGDGQPQLLTYPLDQLDFPLVFGMGAVGKVQPRDVHAGKAHLGQKYSSQML